MNNFINNLLRIFLLCMFIALGLTLLGTVLYLGIFLFAIVLIAIAVIYAKEKLLYMWYKRHPETRKGKNILEIDGVEFILPENYINDKENHFKGK